MKCLFCLSSGVETSVIPRSTRFNGKVFNYKRCKHCSLVFINPIPTKEDYKIMYANEYHNTFYFNKDNSDYSDLLKLIINYKTDGTMLDFGCGDAGFLKFFQGEGFSGTGIEYASELVQSLSLKNTSIKFSTIDDFWNKNQSTQYNFIHLGDVLEHLENPLEIIEKLKSRLYPDTGILIVRGPLEDNASLGQMFRFATAWLTKKVKPHYFANHIPYHITFSNEKNQKQLFALAGLNELYYKIWETPWPYPSSSKGGIATKIKYIIAQISVFISNKFAKKLGNRFLYIGNLKVASPVEANNQ